VEAVNNSPENIYIQHVELNGKKYSKTYILHQDVVKGGSLKITMGNKPNFLFGQAPAARPKSDYSLK
jgi:putative alpha-1,2-mannosidase